MFIDEQTTARDLDGQLELSENPLACTGQVTSDQAEKTAAGGISTIGLVDSEISELGAVPRRHHRHRLPEVLCYGGLTPPLEERGQE